MDKQLLFIKLGGSVVTDKGKAKSVRKDRILRLARQTASLKKDFNTVVFIGAGSFGHPVAFKYRNNLKAGSAKIKLACREIAGIVVDELVKAGLQAKILEPDRVTTYESGKLTDASLDLLTKLLKEGVVPVFHADIVEDRKMGSMILSMDKLLTDLAIFFKKNDIRVERAIFVGSSAGVVINSEGRKKTIRKITRKSLAELTDRQPLFYRQRTKDVSGGMEYKVDQCLKLADAGIESNLTDDLFRVRTLVTFQESED